MPDRPYKSCKHGGRREAMCLGQFGYQESAPADFFTDYRREVSYDGENGGKDEVKSDACPRRHGTETEGFRDLVDEAFLIHAAQPG